jgi:FkbM family methyltransferase
VVDLGGNMGNFTNMALAHGQNIHVSTVEPNPRLIQRLHLSIGLNAGHLD